MFAVLTPHASSFMISTRGPTSGPSALLLHVKANADAEEGQVAKTAEFVRRTGDGSIMDDPHGRSLTVGRLLATTPLRKDLQTRPGPGRRELVYMSGETVIATLNQVFGYDGWDLQVLETKQEFREKLDASRWCVVYTAHVRITLTKTGTFKEDWGTAEATDRLLPTAIQMALKASITDAIKRAARHFGDKLGNCLYQSDFDINKAPRSLSEALDQYDKSHEHPFIK